VCAGIVESTVYASEVVLIFFTYGIIKFSQNEASDYMLMICILVAGNVIISLALKAALSLGICCHLNSVSLCKVALDNAYGRKTYNYRFWKSRRPITVRVGDQFLLNANGYVLTVGKIVTENVIDLLLTF